LKIKGLYVFRALLAHYQEVLHKRHLYCVRIITIAVYAAPPENEQVMLETC
jgi:hypothetical protein